MVLWGKFENSNLLGVYVYNGKNTYVTPTKWLLWYFMSIFEISKYLGKYWSHTTTHTNLNGTLRQVWVLK